MSTVVARTRDELAVAREKLTGTVAVVMTMGALHSGHAELVRQARERADSVIVTVFLNPLQFGPGEDLAKYPRTFDSDLELCEREGVDLVFNPSPDVIYRAATRACGSRPGSSGPSSKAPPGPGISTVCSPWWPSCST